MQTWCLTIISNVVPVFPFELGKKYIFSLLQPPTSFPWSPPFPIHPQITLTLFHKLSSSTPPPWYPHPLPSLTLPPASHAALPNMLDFGNPKSARREHIHLTGFTQEQDQQQQMSEGLATSRGWWGCEGWGWGGRRKHRRGVGGGGGTQHEYIQIRHQEHPLSAGHRQTLPNLHQPVS